MPAAVAGVEEHSVVDVGWEAPLDESKIGRRVDLAALLLVDIGRRVHVPDAQTNVIQREVA